jgi:hypothetical protein
MARAIDALQSRPPGRTFDQLFDRWPGPPLHDDNIVSAVYHEAARMLTLFALEPRCDVCGRSMPEPAQVCQQCRAVVPITEPPGAKSA